MIGGPKAPSSSEEGVGGGGPSRTVMRERATRLRNDPTEPETRLWRELRGSRLGGHKFRRQAVIDVRIADFFCPAKGLIVELDGETHDREADLRRDAAIARRTGYRTVRFTNEDVMRNMRGVLEVLKRELDERPDRWSKCENNHPLTPSFEKEGE